MRGFAKAAAAVALCITMALAAVAANPGGAGATGGEHDSGAPACVAKIDRRVKDVDKLLAKVAAAPDVTAGHRDALTAMLQQARAGLLALRAEIVALQGTTTTAVSYHDDPDELPTSLSPELEAACDRVYTDFRIYALRKPQVHLVLAADRVTGQRALFDLLATELQAAIDAAGSDPDVAEAQRLLDDYRARIDEAWAAAAGVADAVIAFGPQQWNDNHDILDPYVAAVREVKHDLKAAKKDARLIVALLGPAEPKPKS
jgi:hypothetical protein